MLSLYKYQPSIIDVKQKQEKLISFVPDTKWMLLEEEECTWKAKSRNHTAAFAIDAEHVVGNRKNENSGDLVTARGGGGTSQ